MNTKTKVIFNTDRKLKERALKNARAQGVTLSYFLNQALHDIAANKRRVVVEEQVNKKTLAHIDRAYADIQAGKNISPTFQTVDEAKAWLEENA